ncbi:MAG: RluA family pseudouridine synthase [Spirochaetaceae bacterium]|jgi:23S rRNA pseudouridine1911/1915/1917 synthase|nr:RluA family pseudouridine synthase [Spirochaetaceae bacterium]
MPSITCIAKLEEAHRPRLDTYIAKTLRILSRSQIKTRNLTALSNGKKVKLSYTLSGGELLELNWDDAPPSIVVPENIPLDVLYEDGRVIVVNKPQGMVVHPAAGNFTGTLMNALAYRRGGVPTSGARSFIVHRLDKDTSGVIICAYDEDALRFLASQFKSRTVKKTYYAVVKGRPKEPEGRIKTFICRDKKDRKKFTVSQANGKLAVTHYRALKPVCLDFAGNAAYTLLALSPKTGRTHQLRVHLRHIGCPIAGDPLYGAVSKDFPALMLHAARLRIMLPGAESPLCFSAPFPSRFREALKTEKTTRHNATSP